MPEGQGFLARESGRLLEANDDNTPSLRLRTPSGDQRGPIPAPTDKAWAVAFKINVVITVVSAVWALSAKPAHEGEMQGILQDAGYLVSLFVVLAVLTYALSPCMLRAMSSCSRRILQIGFVVFVVGSVMVVNWMFVSGAFYCALGAGVVSAGVGYSFVRRGRISFAAANLKVAALAVRSMPELFLWSLGMTVIRLLWLVANGTALAGFLATFQTVQAPDGNTYRAAECETIWSDTTEAEACACYGKVLSETAGCSYSHRRLEMFLTCYWMASMGWGFMACTNVMTATVARSVALWWSTPEDVEPVWRSCQSVMNSSFGALCKGAAIEGVIQSLDEVAQHLPPSFKSLGCQSTLFPRGGIVRPNISGIGRRPTGGVVYAIQSFGVVFGLPLVLVKLVTNYLQGYISVFVGIQRVSFSEAAGCMETLFRMAGMTLFVNDVLLGVTLLATGLGPIGLYVYWGIHLPSEELAFSIVLFSAAVIHAVLVVFLLPMVEVVLYAYKAVFVSFVQDSGELATQHDRQLHDGLRRAWRDMQMPNPGSRDTSSGVEV